MGVNWFFVRKNVLDDRSDVYLVVYFDEMCGVPSLNLQISQSQSTNFQFHWNLRISMKSTVICQTPSIVITKDHLPRKVTPCNLNILEQVRDVLKDQCSFKKILRNAQCLTC